MPKGISIYGKRIAARRRAIFLTQPNLASQTDQSIENIKRIEGQEIVGVGMDLVEPLAKALRLTIEEFEKNYLVTEIPTDRELQALDLVEYALRKKYHPSVIQRANQLVKQAASQSASARAKAEKKKRGGK